MKRPYNPDWWHRQRDAEICRICEQDGIEAAVNTFHLSWETIRQILRNNGVKAKGERWAPMSNISQSRWGKSMYPVTEMILNGYSQKCCNIPKRTSRQCTWYSMEDFIGWQIIHRNSKRESQLFIPVDGFCTEEKLLRIWSDGINLKHLFCKHIWKTESIDLIRQSIIYIAGCYPWQYKFVYAVSQKCIKCGKTMIIEQVEKKYCD